MSKFQTLQIDNYVVLRNHLKRDLVSDLLITIQGAYERFYSHYNADVGSRIISPIYIPGGIVRELYQGFVDFELIRYFNGSYFGNIDQSFMVAETPPGPFQHDVSLVSDVEMHEWDDDVRALTIWIPLTHAGERTAPGLKIKGRTGALYYANLSPGDCIVFPSNVEYSTAYTPMQMGTCYSIKLNLFACKNAPAPSHDDLITIYPFDELRHYRTLGGRIKSYAS